MRQRFQFGPWEPDQGEIGTDALETAINVLPRVGHYSPFPGLSAVSTGALGGICRGIWYVRTASGVYDTYVATPTQLLKFDADNLTFVDKSSMVYSLPADDFWSGVQYGDFLYVTNLSNGLQVIDVNGVGNFAPAGGSPPIARLINIMDDKIILASLASDPREIAWSDIDDPEEWLTGSAGGQVFPDHGEVMGFLPHARMVLMERGLRSIVSTNDITSFEFPELSFERGAVAPWSVIEHGSFAAWLSTEGFWAGNSAGMTNVNEGRCANYFADNLVHERRHQIFGTYDPFSSRFLWAWPTEDTDYNNRILVWDRSQQSPFGQGRFADIALNTYVISRLATAGVSLEGGSDSVDMDEAGLPSLDSRIYMAGAPILVGVGTDLKLSSFVGPNLAATLATKTLMLGDGDRAYVSRVMPFASGIDSDEITMKVKKRNRQSDDWAITGAIAQQASGWHPADQDGRFHAFQFDIAAAKTWDKAQGFLAEHELTSEY